MLIKVKARDNNIEKCLPVIAKDYGLDEESYVQEYRVFADEIATIDKPTIKNIYTKLSEASWSERCINFKVFTQHESWNH